jgi:transcriptional regulator with XRE-family HTH domain
MPHPLPTYLVPLRKRTGLSQIDIATLLAISASALCRYESRSRRPNVELVVAAEAIFGHPAKEIFPAFYAEIERDVVVRAQKLRTRYRARSDEKDSAALRALDDIIARASQTTLDV